MHIERPSSSKNVHKWVQTRSLIKKKIFSLINNVMQTSLVSMIEMYRQNNINKQNPYQPN